MPLNIMPSRYIILERILLAYPQTHTPLIMKQHGIFVPADTGDDIGIYCIIPKMVDLFNISLDTALQLLIYGSLALAFLTAFVFFFMQYKHTAQRIIMFIGLILLARVSHDLIDVYKFDMVAPLVIIPACLYFYNKKNFRSFLIFIFFSGILLGIFHYIRTSASLPSLFFLITIISLHQAYNWRKKVWLLCALGAGMLLAHGYFSYQYKLHYTYIKEHYPQYNAVLPHHVIWHQIYIGLGFLYNRYGIIYTDTTASDKVKSIDPDITYLSPQYEETLRNEALKVILNDPGFFVHNIWAKIGVILLYFFAFANIGILCALLYHKPWQIDLAFFITFAAAALPIVLTIPQKYYLLGIITCSVLYGITSINWWIGHYFSKKKNWS